MNIILTGMPGAGKSTIGPALAAGLGMEYIDTDQIIRAAEGMELKDIVSTFGRSGFMEIQDRRILELRLDNHVIATGGSVACSDTAMEHLRNGGTAIYLKYDIQDIQGRFDPDRKLARNDGQDLAALFAERSPFYEKNADHILWCSGKSVEDIVKEIMGKTQK